jgi:hypothetical protein
MGKLKLLGDVVEGGLNAIKAAKRTTNEQKAAEKYAAGAQYADPLEPATMRMSEALGNAGAEGKTLNFTEADRSRVFGSNRGGVGFSGLQHYSLPHKEANTVWGFGKKSVAEKKVKQNDPEKSLITTFVGSPTQHKSNSVVIGDAIKEFQKSVKQGDVPREQIMLMNKRLNEITDAKTGAKVFEDGFDLTDPSALSVANTFSRRAAVGDVMLGLGVKGPMSRLDFKKKFPNTKFVDGSNIENILKRETDPDLVNAGTYDVGNRLFVMDGKIIERPDLNEAFPSQVTGYDLGMKYQLVPPNKAMRDFYKARENRLDKNQKPSPVSYYDLARAEPSQFVDEDYLTFLQKEGYKKGGAVHDFDSQEASERVKARIEKYKGGGEVTHHWDEPHNVERFHRKMEMHKATGGLTLKPPTLRMAGGGMLGKGMAKLGKRLMADPTESAVTSARRGERTANEKGGNTIIKETGGNWLGGSVEQSLFELKRPDRATGGRKNPKESMAEMKATYPPDVLATMSPETKQYVELAMQDLNRKIALNDWVDSNLTKYVKKQMGTADDPVRKLAEEGIVHMPTEQVGINRYKAPAHREKYKGQQLGQSDAAKAWEDSADVAINPIQLRDVPESYREPWMDKASPDTKITHLSGNFETTGLGFDHILDVLRADVAEGRIRPEQLNKVSMEQAVRRTYEFDQEMARKSAEAQFKVTEGMPVKKEYPEGYKWVQLAPSKELPKGYSTLLDDVTGSYKVVDENGKEAFPRKPNNLGHINVPFFKTPDEAIADALKRDPRLADALKYEGETMGHCVGSYCPDVLEGKSRIFSLRDSKGEPHVTIETQPRSLSTWDDVTAAVGPEEAKKLWKEFDDIGGNNMSDVGQGFDMFIKQKGIQAPEKIVQIKGKGNAKPKEEYLPFVQDFVRGDNWSDVGDFKNTGLLQPYEVIGGETLKALKAKGIPIPKYLTKEEADELGKQAIRASDIPTIDEAAKLLPPAEGMANGGGILKYTTLRMGKGGLLGKGAKALAGAMKGAEVMPAVEREANLAKFLEPSKVSQRLYHGTTATEGGKGQEAIRRIKPSKEGALGSGVYMTPSTPHASSYTGIPNDEALEAMRLGGDYTKKMADQFMADRVTGRLREGQAGGNMLPVHAQIRNPLIIGKSGRNIDPAADALMSLGMDEASAIRLVERAFEEKGNIGKQIQARAQAQGYDGIMQYRGDDLSEVVSYNPNAVKSAIGNRGTYDINLPDLGKAKGGSILKHTTLRNRNTTQSQPNRFSDGGKSEMKATPRKKGYGVASDVLKGVHEFASKPFGYENPPVEFISELLGIPAASRVLDKLSYGEPITNAGKANVPLIPDDTFDAATALLGGLGTASKLAKPLAKGAKYLPKNLPVGLSIKSVGDGPFGAPSIIIPSKVGNVKEAARQSKGDYGARRVERAADEIPNLEKLYKEEALKEAFTGDNAKGLMTINPADFEKYAQELSKKTSVGPKAAELAKQGEIDKHTVPTDEYIKYLQQVGAFEHLPYLNLFKDEVGLPTKAKILGHEGRHRNRALADRGDTASLVQVNPRGDLREGMPRSTQEEFIEALKQELDSANRLVLPEVDGSYRRPPIKIPDIYAKGGPILKHTTLRNRRANQRVR